MIVKHIIPVTLVDTYTINDNDNNKVIGKLHIYEYCSQMLFGDSRIN